MENPTGTQEAIMEQIDILEKPPSPVLGNSKMTRKFLLARRSQKKSRVKLTDRFSEETTKNQIQIYDKHNILTAEPLTSSQTENVLESIELFEKMQEQCVAENDEQQQVVETAKDFDFKRPVVPAPLANKLNEFQKTTECGGFKTAGGNVSVSISDDMLNKSKNLFDDILNPIVNLENGRPRKYAFLSKRKLENTEVKTDSCDNIKLDKKSYNESINKENWMKFEGNKINSQSANFTKNLDSKSIGSKQSWILEKSNCDNNSCFGFKMASGKDIQVTESALNIAKKKFGEELDTFNPLVSVNELSNSKEMLHAEDMNFLSTQETNELFGDFSFEEVQLGKQSERGHNSSGGEFKGFSENTVEESSINVETFMTKLAHFTKDIGDKNLAMNNNGPIQKDSDLANLKRKRTERRIPNVPRDHQGFTSALGKMNNVSNTTLHEAQKYFKNIAFTSREIKLENNTEFGGFKMASGKKILFAESAINKAKQRFGEELSDCKFFDLENFKKSPDNQDMHFRNIQETDVLFSNIVLPDNKTTSSPEIKPFRGFHNNTIEDSKKKTEEFFAFVENYSGDEETLCPSSCSKSRSEFNNLSKSVTMFSKNVSFRNAGFTSAAGNTIALSEAAVKKAQSIFNSIDDFKLEDNTSQHNGFQISKPASENTKALSEAAVKKAQNIFGSIDDFKLGGNTSQENIFQISKQNMKSSGGFQTAAGSSFTLSADALKKAKQFFQEADSESGLDTFSNTSKADDSVEEQHVRQNISSSSSYSSSAKKPERKKRLGVSACRPVHQISKTKLERAAQLFEDKKSSVASPMRNNQLSVYNSTPLKNAPTVHLDSDITPIKNSCDESFDKRYVENVGDNRILIREYRKGGINAWKEHLENERKTLERKLKMIVERNEALSLQKYLLENNCQDQRKRRNGVLYDKKQSCEKITLQNFLKPDLTTNRLPKITPQNAQFVHFNNPQPHSPYITTSDGASVVPGTNDLIGLSEIEVAFKVMPGVEPELIPTGWIRNHFKWIVWKLASYEVFSTNLKDCLTIENVIQQLKYRYDREIDRAERSTLRKIVEKDDVPQKRMVSCVSNIFDLQNKKFELELTDGWYSIRTVVDEPLCRQISRGKIRVGTKLVTSGAELLNCEGCHPLEVPDGVRLKICCNSTRRAVWYAKLGYQKCPEPFPVKLESVFANGGLIGCMKLYVARIYPIKFLEKKSTLSIWRNEKAEKLQAQEYDIKRRQEMEEVQETIRKNHEQNRQSSKLVNVNMKESEIRKISSPETLYNLYQNSKDPEGLQEILSDSQRKSVAEYQQHLSYRRQQEISREIQDGVRRLLQSTTRDVSPVLQLHVIDVLDPDEKDGVFQIWNPSEGHLELIKESAIFDVHNCLLKRNGCLSATNRTRFKLDSQECSRLSKYKRRLLRISETSNLTKKLYFNEFDTVGIVVQMSVSSFSQNLWLADPCGSLLFVKIFEGPTHCLLLDKVKCGQLVAASNLVFPQSKLEFGEAIANHSTVISCYPQQKHLQEGIEAFNRQFPKDLQLFLEECNQKISYYIDKVGIMKDISNASSKSLVQSSSLAASDAFDDNSDVDDNVFSMIDIDKYS